jgi:hypothetical protein
MNDDRKELKQVQHKLDDLVAKQLTLLKKQQEQLKVYENEKTIYQRFFGQPLLPLDPELVSITAQIADLKEQRKEYFKIIQVSYFTNIRQLLLFLNLNQRKTGPKLRSIQRH